MRTAMALLESAGIWDPKKMSELQSDARLITYTDLHGEFSHDTIYRVASIRMDKEMKRECHLLAAQVFENDVEGCHDHDQLSYHYVMGEAWEKALEHSLEAARPSYDLEAHREASIYYERAWRSLQHFNRGGRARIEVYERLGDLNQEFCRYRQSLDFYEVALEEVNEGDDRARILRKIAYIWGNIDDWAHSEKAMKILDKAMSVENVTSVERGEILSTRASLLFYQRDVEGAIESSIKARDLFSLNKEREKEFWERVNLSIYLFQNGHFDESWHELKDAGTLLDHRIHKKVQVQFFTQRVEHELTRGLYDECLSDLEYLIGLNEDIGYFGDLSYDHWVRGLVHDLMGQNEQALMDSLEALKCAKVDEVDRALIRAYALIAHESLILNDMHMAFNYLEEAEGLIEQRGISSMPFGNGLYYLVLGELHLLKGALEIGHQEVRRGFEILEKTKISPVFQAIGHLWYGDTLSSIGEVQLAKQQHSIAMEQFDSLGNFYQVEIIKNRLKNHGGQQLG
jgi:tetratricopeptide (TPR) repeat protein